MWGLLANVGAGLVKQVLPAAINWGMNKLSNSTLGKTFINPILSTALPHISQHLNQ